MSDLRLDSILIELTKRYGVNYEELQTDKPLVQMNVDNYNNSAGDLNTKDGYNCPLCKNKGFIAFVNDNELEAHTPCKCQKVREVLRRANKSGLGAILSENTFDKYETPEEWQKNAKSCCMAFCDDDKANWFYFGGQVGSGKTHLCTAICGHYIKQGRNTLYMSWEDESKKLKALVTDYYAYQSLINEYKNVEVLYIDDLFKTQQGEAPTKADINLAFEIINNRLFSPDKITIISSEKTLNELLDYDEATMSRICEKTGNYKINIGKDIKKNYRLKNSGVTI